MSGRLTKRCIHNAQQLFGAIVLNLCLDVHSYFTILMSCEVLNSFGINRSVNQVGDIRMTQLVRRHLEVQAIYHMTIMTSLLTEDWRHRLDDALSIDVAHSISVQAANWNMVSDKNKAKIEKDTSRIAAQLSLHREPHVGIKTKLLFCMMRMMQKNNWGSSPAEKEYWRSLGWLGKKRPWHTGE